MESSVITVNRLRRSFGSFQAVKDVSFEVQRGEIFGYLGANGAGKSTTIKMLCGLLAPSGGEALVAGHSISRSPEAVKSSIGYMSQKFSLYLDLPVDENLAFFAGAYGLSGKRRKERISAVLEKTNLTLYLHSMTGDLPGGIRQRLALASALLHEPPIIFLDEPTAGVDPGSRRDFWFIIRTLSKEGVTVFVTTHYMDEAEYCHRIGLMADGELRALDTPSRLKHEWVPGEMISIRGGHLEGGLSAVRQLAGVQSVEPFGSSYRIRFVTPASLEQVTATLTTHGAERLETGPANPTLEDVFLQVVGQKPASEAK